MPGHQEAPLSQRATRLHRIHSLDGESGLRKGYKERSGEVPKEVVK